MEAFGKEFTGEERKKFLSKMYALRAGMSLLSIEKEKGDQLQARIGHARRCEYKRCEDAQNEIENYKSKIEEQEEIEKKAEELYQKAGQCLENSPRSSNKIILAVLSFMAMIAFGVLTYIYWAVDRFIVSCASQNIEWTLKNYPLNCTLGILDQIAGFLFPALVIVCLILGIISIKHAVEAYQEKKQNEELFEFAQKEKSQIDENAKKNIKFYKEQIKEIEVYIDEEKEDVESLEKEENAMAEAQWEHCYILYQALKNEYIEFLDLRDWEHVDLIIYYIETERAFSKREALQLVTNEVHKREIVNTVHIIGDMIAKTLHNEFSILRADISQSFISLSHRITSLQMQLKNQHIEQMQKQKEYMGIINKEVNEAQLNYALDQKADKTSSQLGKDVAYIRMSMEQADMRRRIRTGM